jgi:hypothetical protein
LVRPKSLAISSFGKRFLDKLRFDARDDANLIELSQGGEILDRLGRKFD